ERKSEFCFEVGNETKNPRRRVHVPIKCCGVPCAQAAKKPNHKPGCVNSPADTFSICHPTYPRSSATAATSIGLTAHVSITVFWNKPALFWTNSATSGAAICALMSTRPIGLVHLRQTFVRRCQNCVA